MKIPIPKKSDWKRAAEELEKKIGATDNGVPQPLEEVVKSLIAHGLEYRTCTMGELRDNVREPWLDFPSVQVSGALSAPTLSATEDRKLFRKNALATQRRVLILIDEFYATRKVRFDCRLTLEVLNFRFSHLSLHSTGAFYPLHGHNEDSRTKIIALYRRELRAFGNFLATRS